MKRVFLIDDDPDDKEVFEYALETLPIRTELTYASDGEEALHIIAQNGFGIPDYIFLDINMPKLNGVGFLEELRGLRMYTDVPVYIYTTSLGGPEVDKCVAMGGELCTKHSSFQELCNALQSRIK